jgi:hypothetical protein
MDYYQIGAMIGGLVLAILTGTYGTKWSVAKGKISQAAKLLTDALKAVEDGQLTQDELKIIVADVMALLGSADEAIKIKAKIMARRKVSGIPR